MKQILMMLLLLAGLHAGAQEYMSNAHLMAVKEQSEGQRLAWNKLFDEAVATNKFNQLPLARQQYEQYLEQIGQRLRRLLAEGDGRALLTAVNNYVTIQKQFARDIMRPAEEVTAEKTEDIARINQKITEFSQKERVFLIEIDNAIVSSPEPPPPVDPAMNVDDSEEEEAAEDSGKKKSRRNERSENSRPKREKTRSDDSNRKKLPHEIADEKPKRKKKQEEEEE